MDVTSSGIQSNYPLIGERSKPTDTVGYLSKQTKKEDANISTFNGRYVSPKDVCNKLNTLSEKDIQVDNKTKVLVEDAGARKTTIVEASDGSCAVSTNPMKITHITTSGGGIKGIVLPTVVKVCEDLNIISSIKSLSGTSIGSQFTYFLGIGMNHKEIQKCLGTMKPYSIFYQENAEHFKCHWKTKNPAYEEQIILKRDSPIEVDKERSFFAIAWTIMIDFLWNRIIQPIIAMIQKISFTGATAGDNLEKYLNKEVSTFLLAKIESLSDELKVSFKDIIEKLEYQKKNPANFKQSITFSELDTLSKFLPDIKEVEFTGTALFDGLNQLVIFNKHTHPDMPIATAVRISSSFPRVFTTYKIKNFLNSGEDVDFTDGGCMLNTPTKKMIYSHKKVNIMDADNELIIVFEKNNKKSKKEQDKSKVVNFRAMNALQEIFALNTPFHSHSDNLYAVLDKFSHLVWKAPTAFTFNKKIVYNNTFNIFISAEDIKMLQQKGEKSLIKYLNQRLNTKVNFYFKNTKEAFFTFNDNDFKDICNAIPDQAKPVMNMRNAGYSVLSDIRKAIDDYDNINQPKEEKIQSLIALLEQLDKDFSQEAEFIEWFSNLINDRDDSKLVRFLNLTKYSCKNVNSIFLQKAHEKFNQITFKNRIENLINFKIDKLIYRFFQSGYNQKLLAKAKEDLLKSQTEQEAQTILKELDKKYINTLFDRSKQTLTDVFNSTLHL